MLMYVCITRHRLRRHQEGGRVRAGQVVQLVRRKGRLEGARDVQLETRARYPGLQHAELEGSEGVG